MNGGSLHLRLLDREIDGNRAQPAPAAIRAVQLPLRTCAQSGSAATSERESSRLD
jgi:hypothetical protein